AMGDNRGTEKSRPCDIPAWSCKAGDQFVSHRIGHGYRDDGDCAGCLLGRACGRRANRDDDIGLAPNQFGSQLAEPIRIPICKKALYGKVLSLCVTKFVQSLQEGVEHVEGWVVKLGAARGQNAYPRDLRWLVRAGGEWPQGSRAAEQRYELAPFQLIELHMLAKRVGDSITDWRALSQRLAAVRYFDPT